MDADDLRRLAKETEFDVATLEKDYALKWLLSGIYSRDSPLKDLLIFKGGTAIREIYFPEWRLSEDLDFTIKKRTMPSLVKRSFENVFQALEVMSGIGFSFDGFKSNQYTILADVQFLGPLRFKNRISHDISLKEKLVDKPERRSVRPRYPDVPRFNALVYSLNEILAEKIRSIFQRGKARDYYDVWRLVKEHKFNSKRIRQLLVRKCAITGVTFAPEIVFDKNRLSEAGRFWNIALRRLTKDLPEFDSVVTELKDKLILLQE